ncbi:MAG TPA: hypothetical protein VND45_07685 [Thermoanaerobaculia bacterium]|nr:hypothetical protein [Thermoanaerobaculia bacterium]
MRTIIIASLLLLTACTTTPATTPTTVAETLLSANLTLTDRGPVTQPFLTVEGHVYEVDGGELQLYTYATDVAAQADAAKISPAGEIEGTMVHWMAQPHFYRRGNTLAIYVGASQMTLDALQRTLGAPFAEHP